VHCEDEETIQENTIAAKKEFGEAVPISEHPNIRSAEACYKSSSMAVELAKKHNTRLHVFHLSTEKEIALFDNSIPLKDKKITAEVCIHHLWFDESKYAEKGTLIKWNPAVKKESDKNALFQALLDDKLDVIATDHAPHTLEEKSNTYFNAPSGGPLVQHALPAMLAFVNQGKISIEKVVEKMCHNPAICFQVKNRGFIREGYFADLVLVDLDNPWEVAKDNILYKCGWSPFEGETFNAQITHTFVNGHIAYEYGRFDEASRGMRLTFDR
jgi:dihydroorotase